MTRDETKQIIALIATSYSKHLLPDINEYFVNMWTKMLEDISYQECLLVIQKWVMTEKYPPSISDVRNTLAEIKVKQIDASEAWNEILVAVRKYGRYSEEEALNSLSESTRTVVERFQWEHFCDMPEDEKPTYFAQFRNSFNAIVSKKKEQAQLPEGLQHNIKMLADHYASTKAIEAEHD